MQVITSAHFGANMILTRDSLRDGEPYAEVLKEIDFSSFRYPGGGVTEDQTWENGGLDKIFGNALDRADDDYVLTIREALSFSEAEGKAVTIVTPTFQFYNKDTAEFDHAGFDKYLDNLEQALRDFPDAKISDIEIGNEYWGSKHWGSLSGEEYGKIANFEIPKISEMIERISDQNGEWYQPSIGIQAGVQWKAEQGEDGRWTAVGPQESRDIISQISLDNRELVGTIFQHSYPDANAIEQKIDWAIKPMEVFNESYGFSEDLKLYLSEFNIGENTAIGIEQGAAWLEAFSGAVNSGIDEISHWGIAYEWLSNKFYDTKFPYGESDDGDIVAIATPMGQVFDIAQSYLIDKTVMTEDEIRSVINYPDLDRVSGFSESDQSIIFMFNGGTQVAPVDLVDLDGQEHLTFYELTPANSPHSPWFDESASELTAPDGIADARADMKVSAGLKPEEIPAVSPGEMVVVVVSDYDRDLVIEGAHNTTDPSNGMVNDFIQGGAGNDILRGHVGNDTLIGGQGHNVLSGGKGGDHIEASDDGDVIFTGEGDDLVVGGAGDDLIFSGIGDETGESKLEGGGGHNSFIIGGEKNHTITDFSSDDVIGLSQRFDNIEDFRAEIQTDGNDAIINLPSGHFVRLENYADQADELQDQILDFMDSDQAISITSEHFSSLSGLQIKEVYKTIHDGTETGNEDDYFDSLDTTLKKFGHDDEGHQDDGEHDPTHPDPGNEGDGPVLGLPPQEGPGTGNEDGTEVHHPDDDTGGEPDHEEAPDEPADDTDHLPGFPSEEEVDDHDDIEEDDHDYHDHYDHDHGHDENEADEASSPTCFVATAAFGNPFHPDVKALRAFRDNHLVRYSLGRFLVSVYWIVGPHLASFTKPRHPHAMVVRLMLSAFVSTLRSLKLTAGK